MKCHQKDAGNSVEMTGKETRSDTGSSHLIEDEIYEFPQFPCYFQLSKMGTFQSIFDMNKDEEIYREFL